MKVNGIVFCSLLLIMILSCNQKLDHKVIENKDIKIEHYQTSEITTIHEFVDITNKRWGKTERICEANSGSIDSIFIKDDSIIIRTSVNAFFYDLAALKYGYSVIIAK